MKVSGSGALQNEQLANELHKPIIRKFKKRRVYSTFKDNIWGSDLADMQVLSKYNKGIRFLLCVIDIFSKYAWVVPLKDKKGISIVKAFQIILKQSNKKSNKIWVDEGTEFYNADFKKWLRDNDLVMYSTRNEGKSVVAERFIRTLKSKIYKYMTSISKNVYIDKLDDIVNECNYTCHTTIKMKPIDAKNNTYINTSKDKIYINAIDVKMDGSVLEDKASFKMLGLTFSSKLDWGSYIVSIAKTASKKIGALIRSMRFLSPEVALYLYKSTIRPCMEYCCHVWAGAPSCYLELLDKLQKRICRTVGPSLAASLEPLAHRRKVASLSLFYRYYFGKCSSELVQLVPLPYSRGRSTRYSDRLHDFSVTIPRCYKDVYVNSFFPRTARLWNSLPVECFPLTYDLSGFKSRINSYLLTVGSF